uniref:Solute-binding protein family 3/N-terminal domain-containing protein n=1 Tax=Anopheles coluzzii TaxID=1518534 RepID=A0A6E8VQ53_ANOCL
MSSPNSTFVQMFANERSTTAALLISVLVRIINKTDRFGSNAVALFNFNTHCMDHVPDQLLKQISTITLLNYDSSPLIKDTFERPNFFLHIHGYKVAANVTTNGIITQQVKMLNLYRLFGTTERVVVVFDQTVPEPNPLHKVAALYHRHGVINVIYIVVFRAQLQVFKLDRQYKAFIEVPITASLQTLFPDRLSNLSGQPYMVATYENPPKSYADSSRRIVGADIELIAIIAHHQSTFAFFNYSTKPGPIFVPWDDRTFDFATYRIIYKGAVQYPFSSLLFPDRHSSCIVVPRRYHRVLQEQVIWPFALDLWALSGGLAAFYVWYLLVLAPHLRQHRRDMYDLVNTPLHMFRIVLLFLLTEYYTAMLTSSLGLSQLPFYPTTIQEFLITPTPLLVLRRDLISTLQKNKDIARKMIFYENIEQYQHGQYALIQLCDMFIYTIGSITKYLGKEMSYRHYHLIDEPFTTSITMVPFGILNPRLKRFQMYVNLLNEAGIWNYLMKKWNLKASGTQVVYEPDNVDALFLSLEHFVPVFIASGYAYLITIFVFLLERIVYSIKLARSKKLFKRNKKIVKLRIGKV